MFKISWRHLWTSQNRVINCSWMLTFKASQFLQSLYRANFHWSKTVDLSTFIRTEDHNNQVSISPTFYEHLFYMKVIQLSISPTFCEQLFRRCSFFVLKVWIEIFLAKDNWWESCSLNVGEIDCKQLFCHNIYVFVPCWPEVNWHKILVKSTIVYSSAMQEKKLDNFFDSSNAVLWMAFTPPSPLEKVIAGKSRHKIWKRREKVI
jgi:hypothetical protein